MTGLKKPSRVSLWLLETFAFRALIRYIRSVTALWRGPEARERGPSEPRGPVVPLRHQICEKPSWTLQANRSHCLWRLCPSPGERGTELGGPFEERGFQKRLVGKQRSQAAQQGTGRVLTVTIVSAGVKAEWYC